MGTGTRAGTETRAMVEMGMGTRMGTETETRIGSRRAEERRRSARNRTRLVDAMYVGNGGDLGGKRKQRTRKGLAQKLPTQII